MNTRHSETENVGLSIILCIYNSGETLRSMFESLLNQTMESDFFRLIVVNDGSTDMSHSIIKEYSRKFKYFVYLNRKNNKGVIFSINESIQYVTTDWFLRVDPDDTISTDALEKFIQFIESPYDLILSHRIHRRGHENEYVKVNTNNIFSWIGCGVLIKTEKARRIGLFRDVFWEEFDFYIRYLQEGYNRIHVINLPLYKYNIRNDSITAQDEDRKQGFEELLKYHGSETLKQYGFKDKEYLR